MKKDVSLLSLYAKLTIRKLLLILLAGGLVITGLFLLAAQNSAGLRKTLYDSCFQFVVMAMMILWNIVLIQPQLSESRYTLERLTVTPVRAMLLKSFYNFMTLIVLWAFLAAGVLGLLYWYGTARVPELYGRQSIMYVCYSNPMLHSLLPLNEWSRTVRNIILFLSMAAATGAATAGKEQNQSRVPAFLLAGVSAVFFSGGIGSTGGDIALSVIGIILAGYSVSKFLKGGRADENET